MACSAAPVPGWVRSAPAWAPPFVERMPEAVRDGRQVLPRCHYPVARSRQRLEPEPVSPLLPVRQPELVSPLPLLTELVSLPALVQFLLAQFSVFPERCQEPERASRCCPHSLLERELASTPDAVLHLSRRRPDRCSQAAKLERHSLHCLPSVDEACVDHGSGRHAVCVNFQCSKTPEAPCCHRPRLRPADPVPPRSRQPCRVAAHAYADSNCADACLLACADSSVPTSARACRHYSPRHLDC